MLKLENVEQRPVLINSQGRLDQQQIRTQPEEMSEIDLREWQTVINVLTSEKPREVRKRKRKDRTQW